MSAAASDQIRRCRLPERRCRLFPKKTRLSTLATFVSTAGTGFSYAKLATAPAVYRPIPGSLISSGNAFVGNASPGNAFRELMEVPRPRIISQPVPSLPHRARFRPRQAPEIRKPLEEARIILAHPAHLRLLQHDLGHEHAIWIAGAAPRQVARRAGVPGEEASSKVTTLRRCGPHPLSPSPFGRGGTTSRVSFPLSTLWRGGQGERTMRGGQGMMSARGVMDDDHKRGSGCEVGWTNEPCLPKIQPMDRPWRP